MRLLSDGGKITIKTGLDNSGIEKDLAAMSSLIKGSTAVIGAAMAAATTAVVGFGSAYETSMAKASTLFGDVAVDTENLNGKILSLSGSSGKAASELNETLYQALSAGVPVTEDMGQALNAVEAASKLATSGFTTSASAIDVMTTAANAYSDAGYEMSEISDILLMTQNKGKTTVDELASSLGRVLPVASAYCVSLEDVGAAEATMTANGIATAESTTYLKGMLNELGDSGSGVSKILQEKTGMAFAQLMEAGYSLGDVMQILQDSVNGDATAFANLWSSQEAGVGSLSIANTGAQAYNETLKEMQNSAGTTEDAYSKMSDTLEFKGNQMKETAKNLAISVYNDLEESLKNAADVGTSALEGLQAALGSPAFKESAEAVADGIGEVAEAAGDIASTVLPMLGKVLVNVGSNLKTYAALALAAVAATKAFSVAKTASTIISKMVSAWKIASAAVDAYCVALLACTAQGVICNKTLTAGQAVVGLLATKIPLATAAQTLWNAVMSANPIGLLVTGVAALAAGIAAYTIIMDESKKKNYELSESQQKVLDKGNETIDALNGQRSAREESIQAIDREYAGYDALLTELQSITDENGNVKAGYEDRAKVITGELSNALGVEITMLDGQIQKYGEVVESIKEVITQKKAEALLSSMQDDMAKAYENSTKALESYKDATKVAADAKKNLEEAQDRVNKVEEQWGDSTAPAAVKAQTEANNALADAQKAYDDASASMQGAKSSLEDLTTEVNNYDALMEAVASGDTARIEDAMNALITSYRSYTSEALASSEETRKSLYDQANGYAENIKLIQDGTVQVADSVYQETARAARNTLDNFNQLPGGIAEGIRQIGPEAGAALLSALADADLDGKLDVEGKQDVQTFIDSFSGLDSETQAVWSQAWYGALKGLEGFEELADPAQEGAETFLESLKAALEVHSPSAAAEAIFAQVWPGASQGLDQGKEELSSKGSGVISEFLATLGTGVSGAQDIGSSIMSMFGLGISSQAGNSHAAGAANASAAQAGAGSINPSGIGGLFGTLFGSAISGASGTTGAAGLLIATAAQKAAGGVNPSDVGRAFTSTFGGAIGASGTLASSAAKGVASTAKGSLESVSTASSGNMFGSGFSAGIRAMVDSAVDAASSLASAALSTIKNVLDIHSPSRTTRNFGRLTGEGLALGIEDKMAEIKAVASKLSRAALDGMNVEALATKMTAAVKESNIATSSGIAANIRHTVEKEQEDGSRLEERLDKMVGQFVEALGNLTLKYKEREVARMVKEVIN